MQLFLYKQNILLLYMIMSFENFYLFKSHAWIKNTCLAWKMDLRNFIIKIESYGNIILYFCEIGNMKEIFDFGL